MLNQLIVGKDFTWDWLNKLLENYEDAEINEHGKGYVGENALHLQIENMDLWFILDSASSITYYYKLVYKK